MSLYYDILLHAKEASRGEIILFLIDVVYPPISTQFSLTQEITQVDLQRMNPHLCYLSSNNILAKLQKYFDGRLL